MTNPRWSLLNNPKYRAMFIIHIPLMICLIKLDQTQAPYLVSCVNVRTFQVLTHIDLHKRLVLVSRQLVLLPRQLTIPLRSPSGIRSLAVT